MPPAPGCPGTGLAYPEVTRAICLVPSASFSQAPRYALPVHLCRFRVRSMLPALFPGPLPQPAQSDKGRHGFAVVTSGGPGNVHPVPIGYGLRPRLRGRLTLRGLALRRNPWSFGERASHPLYRYSCLHSHFRYLHGRLPFRFAGVRNAPLPLSQRLNPKLRCITLAPLHLRRRTA